MWQPSSPVQAGPSSAAFARERSDSIKQRNPGRRFGQIIKLKPDAVEEFKKTHAQPWPEVLKQFKERGIVDYSIFHDAGTGMLFASFKYVGYDYNGDMEMLAENGKVKEWWQMTDKWQESLVDGAKSSADASPTWWKPVEEVFYMA